MTDITTINFVRDVIGAGLYIPVLIAGAATFVKNWPRYRDLDKSGMEWVLIATTLIIVVMDWIGFHSDFRSGEDKINILMVFWLLINVGCLAILFYVSGEGNAFWWTVDTDGAKPHIHLEQLNPQTGEVIANHHFYYNESR